jgi:hypothetical protein
MAQRINTVHGILGVQRLAYHAAGSGVSRNMFIVPNGNAERRLRACNYEWHERLCFQLVMEPICR